MELTKTRSDLVNQALTNLGVLAAGQTPPAEDFNTVDAHVDPLIASLDARDIARVADDEAIPVEWFSPLAVLLAQEAAMSFGLPGVPQSASTPDPVLAAEDKLRLITRSKPTGEVLETEYF